VVGLAWAKRPTRLFSIVLECRWRPVPPTSQMKIYKFRIWPCHTFPVQTRQIRFGNSLDCWGALQLCSKFLNELLRIANPIKHHHSMVPNMWIHLLLKHGFWRVSTFGGMRDPLIYTTNVRGYDSECDISTCGV